MGINQEWCEDLGSKRGVKSGVAPIIREESIMFLAGVTRGRLLDLHPELESRLNIVTETQATAVKESDRLMEVFCVVTDSAFARFDVLGGFFVVLP